MLALQQAVQPGTARLGSGIVSIAGSSGDLGEVAWIDRIRVVEIAQHRVVAAAVELQFPCGERLAVWAAEERGQHLAAQARVGRIPVDVEVTGE